MLKPATRTSAVIATAALGAMLLASPAEARDRYTDAEGSNPVRIVSYLVHPVGAAVEWLVLRPIHAVGQVLAPDRRQHVDNVGHCRGHVPSRRCTPYYE